MHEHLSRRRTRSHLEHVRRNDALLRRTHDRPPRWTGSAMLPHTWQVLRTIRSVLLGGQAVPSEARSGAYWSWHDSCSI